MFKSKVNLSLIIIFLSAVLIALFVVYPLFDAIKKSSQELVSQKENLISLEAKITALKEFKVNQVQYSPKLEKIENLFIDSEVPVDFVDFLEKAAKDCQVEIGISLVPQQKTKTKQVWSSLDFQINSKSSASNLLKFIEKLEASPYLIEVQNLNINRLNKEEQALAAEIQSTFSIRVYAE